MDESDDEARIKKDITSHLDPTAGKTRIHLTPSDTDLVGDYYYDIQVKRSPENDIVTLMSGKISFTRDVTLRS